MKELDLIKIIKDITNNKYIGDDCAYLPELGITVTQDNFVENVHFKTDWAAPFQIGYKAAAVNISDILASGAKPAYLTVGLSIPSNISDNFIKELFLGVQKGSYGAEIIGGDITAGDKIFISITAIGKADGRKISSRACAKPGYVVITHGEYGKSKIGYEQLKIGIKNTNEIRIHLEPKLEPEFSKSISSNILSEYAMMDTSDGLADALFKIAEASNCTIIANDIDGMFGFEDYNLVAAVPEDILKYVENYYIIGQVKDFDGYYLGICNKKYSKYDELETYDHFK